MIFLLILYLLYFKKGILDNNLIDNIHIFEGFTNN